MEHMAPFVVLPVFAKPLEKIENEIIYRLIRVACNGGLLRNSKATYLVASQILEHNFAMTRGDP